MSSWAASACLQAKRQPTLEICRAENAPCDDHFGNFLVALLIIFTVPFLIWRLGRTDYYAALVVVQILCGILLGPGLLGSAFPQYYTFVFNSQVIGALNGISWWAVMMFVWVAGIIGWLLQTKALIMIIFATPQPILFGDIQVRLMTRSAN